MTHLHVEGLRKTYDDTVAVDCVDLSMDRGQFLALLGPSGCGKTTFLRMLAGFERPDHGRIELGGRVLVGDGRALPPEHRRIGLVFQEYALFPHLTVEGNVGFGVRGGSDRRRKVGEMLDLVGLAGLGKRMPHELSGGQQQRVALARTLATEPDLVLLDEPFSNLDPSLRQRVRTEVWQILREFGATAIMVTHDQEEALSLPGLVGVMLRGSLRQVAFPADLYSDPVDREVAEFIGDANFIRGQRRDGIVISGLGPLPLDGPDDGAVQVMVRPEHIVVDDTSPVQGEVIATEFFGHDQLVQLALDDGETVRVRVLSGQRFAPGERHGLRVRGHARAWAVEDATPA